MSEPGDEGQGNRVCDVEADDANERQPGVEDEQDGSRTPCKPN